MENKILGIALNEEITFEVTIDKISLLDKILKRKSRKYIIKRFTTLKQNIEITKLLIGIPDFDFDNKSDSELLQLNIDYIAKYSDIILKIVALILKEKNIQFLRNNLSNKDLLNMLLDIFGMIDFQSFTSTIALLRNKASLKS